MLTHEDTLTQGTVSHFEICLVVLLLDNCSYETVLEWVCMSLCRFTNGMATGSIDHIVTELPHIALEGSQLIREHVTYVTSSLIGSDRTHVHVHAAG